MTEIFEVIALVTLNVTIAAIVFLSLFSWALRHFDPKAVRLEIRSRKMADVVEGGTFAFTVVATNKAGRVVADTNVSVAVDANGSATVNPDGSGGVFTAGATDGPANLTATDGTLTSAPFALNVTADNTPAVLTVTPA
jgi:hypothetical protein